MRRKAWMAPGVADPRFAKGREQHRGADSELSGAMRMTPDKHTALAEEGKGEACCRASGTYGLVPAGNRHQWTVQCIFLLQ